MHFDKSLSPLEKLHPELISNILRRLPEEQSETMIYVSKKLSALITRSMIYTVKEIKKEVEPSNVERMASTVRHHIRLMDRVSLLAEEELTIEYLTELQKVVNICKIFSDQDLINHLNSLDQDRVFLVSPLEKT